MRRATADRPSGQLQQRRIRVLVVDDSALVRQLLRTIIDAQPDMRCVGVAKHAAMALQMVQTLAPDVLTLDIEMPGMSGLELLERLMHSQPLPVVMISAQTCEGAETTLRALEMGAVDFVLKPRIGVADGLHQLAQALVEKIRAAAQANVASSRHHGLSMEADHAVQAGNTPAHSEIAAGTRDMAGGACRYQATATQLVAIGASTGGTDAIRTVLQGLPETIPPVVIVQHMPAGFTRSFAARLDADCALRVCEARDGDVLRAGHAYVAPGGLHLRVQKSGTSLVARLAESELVMHHRPSVDVLFRSALLATARHTIAVLLTGMGTDGAQALRALRQAGAYTIAQDAASSVVYGMPREAALLDAAVDILPLAQIAAAVVRHALSE
ncbi:hypothetical protein AAV94_08745 [Lampropedia cohaerens]|uniref:Protein-glutamate methylesterase/protein-glutamine glutaminase n=1 Tax=Lampropedia cohaerens TaxID=1610491 RepID=A0A0U1PYX0_9BURK|nr:chemotaxis response regulator protein-glutamate methylesterase [Lampropedia cohaerens]KKW67719.1 hypothetical protein AAV94_08745 [Lampropedia cohaerens]